MKKVFFTLAVLVMAFGNVSFAQHKTNLKTNEKEIVFRHYGLRNDDIRPLEAVVRCYSDESYRYTYSYDEYDYYLTETLFETDLGDGWLPFGRITYEYDFAGNVLEMVGYEWEDGDWMEETQALYSYSMDGMEVVYQNYVLGSWYNDYKEVYNYNGDMTTILIWEWNGSNWASSELHTYTYSDTSVEVLMQYMQGGAWQNSKKYLYTLDFSGNVTEILYQAWLNTNWDNREKTNYEYEGDVFTSKRVVFWQGDAWGTGGLLFNFSYEDGNATHGECLDYYVSSDEWLPADGDIEMAYNYNMANDVYYGSVVDVTYFDVTALNENTQSANFKVYPNPAKDEISIQTENFGKAEVYSVTGQKVMESTSNSINVSQLEAGVYLLKVLDLDGNSETQRIVVK